MSRPETTTHYATTSRVLASVWIVAALLLLFDVVLRGEGRSAWIATAILVASVSVVYIVWLRPRVVSAERGIRVVNPLRETFVPWAAVQWVDVTDVLRVHTPAQVVRSWPLRETKRSKVRDNMRRDSGFVDSDNHEDFANMRPVDLMARQLRQDAERRKTRPLGGPIEDVDEAGPAALGAEQEAQTMVPVEVILVLSITAVFVAVVFVVA